MSKMIDSFDPSVDTSGTFDHKVSNPCGGIYLFNESNIWQQLRLPGGHLVGLPAWWSRFYKLDEVLEPVQWQTLATIPSISTPLSQVYGEAYESSELKGRSFYDGPIPRNPYIGNQVSSNMSTNQVINDGNLAPMAVLETTQQGNTDGSNVQINNDSSGFFAEWAGSVWTKYIQFLPGLATVLKLGASGAVNRDIEILHNLIIDNAIKLSFSAIVLNGNTAGTASLWEPIQGTALQVVFCALNGFRNGAAGTQSIALPSAFTTNGMVMVSDVPGLQLNKVGSPITISTLNAIGSNGASGTLGTATTINGANFGFFPGGWDTLVFTANEITNRNGILLAIGI